MKQVQSHLRTTFAQHQKETQPSQQPFLGPSMTPTRSSSGPVRRTVVTRVFEAVRALALCHNVTPVYEDSENSEAGYETEADQQIQQEVVYQASSPDEVSVRQRLTVSKRGYVCTYTEKETEEDLQSWVKHEKGSKIGTFLQNMNENCCNFFYLFHNKR